MIHGLIINLASKKKKKTENYHRVLHIRISLSSEFQPQQTILIFCQKQKK